MLYNDDMKLDKRIVRRNMEKGLTEKKDYKKHIKGLKDMAKDSDKIEAQLERMTRQLPASPETDEDEL